MKLLDLFFSVLLSCCFLSMEAQTTFSEKIFKQINQLDHNSSEESIGNLIDQIKKQEIVDEEIKSALIKLLAENNPVLHDRDSKSINRIHAYILASFEKTGATETAIPYILSSLQNSNSPHLIAAASIALRSLKTPLKEGLSELLYLLDSYLYRDEATSFSQIKTEWPLTSSTTTVTELLKSIAWYGSHAKEALSSLLQIKKRVDEEELYLSNEVYTQLNKTINSINNSLPHCCQISIKDHASDQTKSITFSKRTDCTIKTILLEDQEGSTIPFNDFFNQPTVLVFFYTRCDNPNKCSLTISRLAKLQALLVSEQLDRKVKIAAISYDPYFDTASDLKQYTSNRALVLNEQTKAFRSSTEEFEHLKSYFNIKAAYQGEIVSTHAIELYLLDSQARIAAAFTRLNWDQDVVVQKLRLLLEE